MRTCDANVHQSWALGHPGVVAMSMRNEMRQLPVINSVSDWYTYIQQAGALVAKTNPNVLIVVGGVYGGMDLSQLKTTALDITWPGRHVVSSRQTCFWPSSSYTAPRSAADRL
jgi:hypothetical protein